MSSHIPFDKDIRSKGKYVYTGNDAQLSSIIANRSQSRLIHAWLNSSVASLIDIGCGDGEYTFEYLEFSNIKKIVGVDPSPLAIESAKSDRRLEPRISFISGMLEDIGFEKDEFDVAILRGVLHHATDPEQLLRHTSIIAKKVIVLEPNGLNPILKIIEKVSKYHRDHQERSFTRFRIKKWLSSTGGKVVNIKVAIVVPFFSPKPIALVLSAIEPIVERLPVLRWILCGTQIFEVNKLGNPTTGASGRD